MIFNSSIIKILILIVCNYNLIVCNCNKEMSTLTIIGVDINKLSNYTYAYARGLKDKAAY